MIEVTTTAGNVNQHARGQSWHVDEVGDLHVRKANKGNVATYARCLWVSVAEVDD